MNLVVLSDWIKRCQDAAIGGADYCSRRRVIEFHEEGSISCIGIDTVVRIVKREDECGMLESNSLVIVG